MKCVKKSRTKYLSIDYRKSYPVSHWAGRNGSPEHPQDAITKSEKQNFNMGSVMIIFLIAHLFRKDQTYASLFSSALKEGIRDTFGQATETHGNDGAKENFDANDK